MEVEQIFYIRKGTSTGLPDPSTLICHLYQASQSADETGLFKDGAPVYQCWSVLVSFLHA